MLHHKLLAGETPGTYLLTALVNEDGLLTIASQTDLQTQAKSTVIIDEYLLQ